MEAVANVVLNRVAVADRHGGYWWGNTVLQVCLKPYQFSCWNKNDSSFNKIRSVDENDVYFVTALRVARRAISGVLRDHTGGATHYHADYVAPYWAVGHKPTIIIGRHLFFKLIEV